MPCRVGLDLGIDAGDYGALLAKRAFEARERAALRRVKSEPSVDRQPTEFAAMVLEQNGRPRVTKPTLNIVTPLPLRRTYD